MTRSSAIFSRKRIGILAIAAAVYGLQPGGGHSEAYAYPENDTTYLAALVTAQAGENPLPAPPAPGDSAAETPETTREIKSNADLLREHERLVKAAEQVRKKERQNRDTTPSQQGIGKQWYPRPFKSKVLSGDEMPVFHEYRTQQMPPAIYRSAYSRDNSHLPPSITYDDYDTLLFNAVARGELNVIRALMDDRKRGPEVRNVNGDTPLIYAIRTGQTKPALLLLARKANPNAMNNAGHTALHNAVFLKKEGMVASLLKMQANPNIRDEQGVTPLMLAASTGQTAVAQMLVRNGASPNITDNAGRNALHLAVQMRNGPLASYLLEQGAVMDAQDQSGMTPLMYAAANGQGDIVHMLIQAGADFNIQNLSGMIAYDIARFSGHMGVADRILRAELDRRARAMPKTSAVMP